MACNGEQPFCADRLVRPVDRFPGQWIDIVHGRRPPKGIVLDMDSSVSPTHGEQENSVWNGHYACTCYHPLFAFNQFGDLETLHAGNVHSADGWESVFKPVIVRYQSKVLRIYFRADAAPARSSPTFAAYQLAGGCVFHFAQCDLQYTHFPGLSCTAQCLVHSRHSLFWQGGGI